MYLSIEEIKKQLNIDEFFHDDDEYLIGLSDAAELATAKFCDRPIQSLVDANGNLEAPIKQCVLLMIGNMYNNREATSNYNVVEVPLGYRFLADLYQDYSKKSFCH